MIHTFAATAETQGQRDNDFCFVPEGELVTFPVLTCTNEEPDGHCGCCRSMGGVKTHKATTTMKVVEVDRQELERVLCLYFREAGWSKAWSHREEREAVVETADALEDAAAQYPIGTIVELRGDEFGQRQPQAS